MTTPEREAAPLPLAAMLLQTTVTLLIVATAVWLLARDGPRIGDGPHTWVERAGLSGLLFSAFLIVFPSFALWGLYRRRTVGWFLAIAVDFLLALYTLLAVTLEWLLGMHYAIKLVTLQSTFGLLAVAAFILLLTRTSRQYFKHHSSFS